MKPITNLTPTAVSPEIAQKLRQAIAEQPSSPSDTNPLPMDSGNITISSVSFEDSLAKELLPANYRPSQNKNGLYETHRSYLYLADQKMEETKSAEKLQSITDSLVFNSRQAHSKVRDMFTQLGGLTQETDSLLLQSEKYLYSEIGALRNTHAEQYHERTSKYLDLHPSFEFEVTTQEGDKVSMKFGYTLGATGHLYSTGVQLEMQVEGDLSAEENEALSALYEEVGKYVEQTMQSDRFDFAVTAFDLDKGFDAGVLSGFEVATGKTDMTSWFSYEIDNENNSQRLRAGMGLAGDILNYDLDITTALGGSDQGKEQVLANLLNTLEKMDTGRYMDTQVNEFLTETFASMLSKTKSDKEHEISIADVNQAIKKTSARLEGHELAELSQLADYQFSLKISQLSDRAYHESTIKMSQDSERKVDALGKHVSQTNNLDVTMFMMRFSVNTLKGHETNWRLDKEQTLDVTLDRDNELKNHKISGHHKEELEQKYFVDNTLKHTFAQQVNSSFSQELEVLEDAAKLTIEEKDEHKGGLYSRIADNAKDTLAESRYIREYRQVINFEEGSEE